MADTKPIHVLSEGSYVSANTLTSIPVGTDMFIQNQSRSHIKLAVSVSEPPTASTAYILVPPDTSFPATITGETSEVWLLGLGPVCIQEL